MGEEEGGEEEEEEDEGKVEEEVERRRSLRSTHGERCRTRRSAGERGVRAVLHVQNGKGMRRRTGRRARRSAMRRWRRRETRRGEEGDQDMKRWRPSTVLHL